ncbi:MAG: MFS transporter [Legionella sp.]|uniref:MFS transporter n=1 Tax=Legionella sp. TaxID=459 RepID=UPI0039E5903F
MSGIFMMIGNLTALIKLADDDAMKNRIIVLQSVVYNLSFSVSSFFMSYFYAQSLRSIFLTLGFTLLISGVFVLNFKTDSVHEPTTGKKVSFFQIKSNLPSTSMIIFMIFFYGIIYSLVKIFFPVETISRFNNSFYSWLILSINPLMIIFFQPLLISKLKSKGSIFLLLSSSLLLGIGYALFGISTYFIFSILSILLATIGEMVFSPISKKLAATSFGYGNEGYRS